MLSLDAFLARIWPSNGDLVVVQLEGNNSLHFPFTTVAQAVTKIRALEQTRANIYIACAGYRPGSVKIKRGRTGENAEHFRSLWLDLDVGSEVGKYPTQRDAATALKTFIDTTSLPAPLVVSSGGGLHVYWPLDTDIDRTTWQPLALGLKRLCLLQGLKIDVRCTADAARILRPVETTNWKTGNARPVTVKLDAPATPLTTLQQMLLVAGTDTKVNGSHYALTTLDQSSTDPTQFDGAKILAGCQQMQWAMQHPNDVPEPMWREMIGTLYKSNAPHLIHTLSQGHSNYDYAETEAKARNRKGAGALCSSLEAEHPGGCVGCVHLGVIKSPSAIGFIVTQLPPVKIDPVTSMPQGWFHKDGELWTTSEEGPYKLYDGIIEIGFPYTDSNTLGQKRTLIPVATIVKGARTENYVDYAVTATPSDLYRALTTCGIVIGQRYFKPTLAGMRSWLQEARTQAAIAPARRQLGWDSTAVYDHKAAYVLGEHVHHPKGSVQSTRLSDTIKAFGRDIHTHGTLQGWQRAFNLLGLPGYEAHMVMSWIAFGAPLVRMDATAAAMVHAYSQTSSQGKTTVLNFINSVYGDPHAANLMWTGNVTPASIHTGLTIMNGLPMGIDEITQLGFDASRRLLYECTQQMGRKRLQQNGVLQEATMTKTMLYSTGNASLQNIASIAPQLDDTPLQARLVEIVLQFPPMTAKERSDRRMLVESVKEHFGHAAPIYIQYVVDNQAGIARQLAGIRAQLEQATQAENVARFQITSMAAMITGAYIARYLKLIDHPVEHGIQWITDWFMQQQGAQQKAGITPASILERLIGDFQTNVLIVDMDRPIVTSIAQPKQVDIVKHPSKDLLARYALDTQRLYIIAHKVKTWLVQHGLNVQATLDTWHQLGLLVDLHQTTNKLGGYTKYNMERQRCYIFDLTKLDALPDGLIQ